MGKIHSCDAANASPKAMQLHRCDKSLPVYGDLIPIGMADRSEDSSIVLRAWKYQTWIVGLQEALVTNEILDLTY